MYKYAISVVMPAYNVGKYISEAIEGILNQSFTDWELIVVDDCSIDNTEEIVNKYVSKYSQIRLIKREQNSGGCRLPRFDGILAANGEFVCPVDSDDLWEKDYLQKLYLRQQATNSTLVLGRMIFCDEKGNKLNRMIPQKDFDFSLIETGKDACKRTIGGWEIALAGLLAETTYYQDYIKSVYYNNCNYGFADEIDHRRLLLGADKVAYIDAHYYYRQHPNSIIHNISVRKFDIVKAYLLLDDFVFVEFPKDKIIQNQFCLEFLKVIYYSYSSFYIIQKKITTEQKESIKELLTQAYSKLKTHRISGISVKEMLLLKNLFFLKLIARIQNIYTYIK